MNIADVRMTIIVKINNQGIRGLLKETVFFFFSRIFFFKKYMLFTRMISDPIPEIKIPEEISFKLVRDADMSLLENIATPKTLRNFSELFRQGKVCLVALNENKPVYYSWLSFEQKNFLRIKHNEAYFFNSFTLPKYRGLGIHTKLTTERLRIIKERNYEIASALVLPKNIYARMALEKTGFRKTGEALRLDMPLFGIKYAYVSRRLPDGSNERYSSLKFSYSKQD